jgi:hypothetical protein
MLKRVIIWSLLRCLEVLFGIIFIVCYYGVNAHDFTIDVEEAAGACITFEVLSGYALLTAILFSTKFVANIIYCTICHIGAYSAGLFAFTFMFNGSWTSSHLVAVAIFGLVICTLSGMAAGAILQDTRLR